MCQTTTEAYRELVERVRSRQPLTCPRCGSGLIQPTFLAQDEWDCAELMCLATFQCDPLEAEQ